MNKLIFAICCIVIAFIACNENQNTVEHSVTADSTVIDSKNITATNIPGRAPSIFCTDGIIHLTFSSGDSILYSFSSDGGQSFSKSTLVSLLKGMAVAGGRGPQIAGNKNQLVIAAANEAGNIYSYTKSGETWINNGMINDVSDIAKEGFVSLASNGSGKFYAVWLDLRNDKQNKIAGSVSNDAGKSWSVNKIIYRSPDASVCECCKPSVVMKNDHVVVMFRNWIDGNRDLYLMQSHDGGNNFTQSEKLGKGSWALKGCPMDGGSVVLDQTDRLQTVWRREDKIFTSTPGSTEMEIGKGKNCTMESLNGNNVYAWTEKGEVVLMTTSSNKKLMGPGKLPIVKALNNKQVVCAWEDNNQIKTSVFEL